MTPLDMPQRFTKEMLQLLQKAGWFPGRNVTERLVLPDDFSLHPKAQSVLSEFAYLRAGQAGPGIERARSTVVFDPMLAFDEADRFAPLARLLHRHLYPLGEVDNGHFFLVLDDIGRVFLMMDCAWFVGATFEAALDTLLTGKSLKIIDDNGNWS